MSTTAETRDASGTTRSSRVEMNLEVIVIPVSDVDRAKAFYTRLGWRLDADFSTDDGFRIVQFTPAGSGCSVHFGTYLTAAAPGSSQAQHLAVTDVRAVREDLARRGIPVSDVYHCSSGLACRYPAGTAISERVSGPAEDHRSYSSFVSFDDPDGNNWVLQEITTRLPGRVDPSVTSYPTAGELAEAMRRASIAHGEHEKRIGQADASWPQWYAEYMVAEQAGATLPL